MNEKIVEYKLIGFSAAINENLKLGFELYGNPFVDSNNSIHQAMIKKEEKSKGELK